MVAVTLAIELLLMNCIGIFIRKSGLTNKEFSAHLTNLILTFCIPCLIFNSVSNAVTFTPELLANCGVVILVSGASLLLSFLLGQLAYFICNKNGVGRIMRYGITFCHFSFMGIPVIEALFGDMGIFYYASFFLFPVRIAYYAFSDALMTPQELRAAKKSFGKMLKEIFLNPCTLALILGVIFWIAGWHLPEVLNYCVKTMSSLSSPLALLLCGMVLAEHNFRTLLKAKYFLLPLLRTVVMPCIFFGISRLLLQLGVDELLCNILVIFSALPVSSLLPIFTIRSDPNEANQLAAAASTTLSVPIAAVTIPIWYMLLGI